MRDVELVRKIIADYKEAARVVAVKKDLKSVLLYLSNKNMHRGACRYILFNYPNTLNLVEKWMSHEDRRVDKSSLYWYTTPCKCDTAFEVLMTLYNRIKILSTYPNL